MRLAVTRDIGEVSGLASAARAPVILAPPSMAPNKSIDNERFNLFSCAQKFTRVRCARTLTRSTARERASRRNACSFGPSLSRFGLTSGRARAIKPWRNKAGCRVRDYLFRHHDLDNIFES
jgi:hypothetical protein